MGRDQLCGVAFEMIRRSVQLLFALRYDRFGARRLVPADTGERPLSGRSGDYAGTRGKGEPTLMGS